MWNRNWINGVGMSPCYGCGDRQEGCHGSCELYKGWRETVEEIKAVRILKARSDPGVSMARIKASRKRAVDKVRGRF